MKKILCIEIGVLAVLAVIAVIVSITLNMPAFSPDSLQQPVTTAPTQATPAPTPPPTEPAPTWKTYPEDRELLAKQYFVYDCKTGSFLTISGKMDERIYPASITKLFTAYVAMQYLTPDTQITAGSELDLVAWGSSVAKIKKGDTLTAGQLVEAMLLPSGNDAAYMLACAAGRAIEKSAEIDGQFITADLDARSAVNVFMKKMNELAKDLGMAGTNFVNPDGIHDSNHYTTFGDLVILGKLSMENETIMKHAITPNKDVQLHGETITWKNTNALVNPTTEYYCPYAVGLKTGQTPSAGSCLLSAFRKGDTELIIGVFGCPEEEDRFDDTLQLFNQIVLK